MLSAGNCKSSAIGFSSFVMGSRVPLEERGREMCAVSAKLHVTDGGSSAFVVFPD